MVNTLFGINLTAVAGTAWSSEDKQAIQEAVWRVATRLASATNSSVWRGGGTGYLATTFKAVYGIRDNRQLRFHLDPHIVNNQIVNYGCYNCRPNICRTPKDPLKTGEPNEYWENDLVINGEQDCDCKPIGGYTHTVRSIEFASLWDNYDSKGSAVKQLRKVNNVIHELGHAFSARLDGKPKDAVHAHSTTIGNEEWRMESRPLGFYVGDVSKYGTMTWVQSPTVSDTEVFADMFLGWVYNKWDDTPSGRVYGQERARFMNARMPGWIRDAMRKP